jgi:hypothetical protein
MKLEGVEQVAVFGLGVVFNVIDVTNCLGREVVGA